MLFTQGMPSTVVVDLEEINVMVVNRVTIYIILFFIYMIRMY